VALVAPSRSLSGTGTTKAECAAFCRSYSEPDELGIFRHTARFAFPDYVDLALNLHHRVLAVRNELSDEERFCTVLIVEQEL
jgi:hypothetical protein